MTLRPYWYCRINTSINPHSPSYILAPPRLPRHRGSWLSRGHGTEQNLETRGSVAEVENELRGTIPFSGRVTEQNLGLGESVAERSPRIVPFRIPPWW